MPRPNLMQQANTHREKTSKTGSAILIALCSLVVLFSFAITTATTDRAFKRGDDRLMQLFDSGVYLNSARTILKIKEDKTAESQVNGAKARMKELAYMLILDGPVLPTVAAKAINLGKGFRLTELNSVAMLMSLLQALVCGLVFILSWRATCCKSLAFFAALAWSLYPPALTAAQRLGTESIAAVFLLTTLLCLSATAKVDKKGLRHLLPFAYAGVFFAFLLLTKPVLMFCVLLPAVFALSGYNAKRAAAGLLVFSCMTAIALAPFWVFTKQATGSICWLPQRMPVLNAIVTNNLINDGLGCLPTAPLQSGIGAMKSVAEVQLAYFKEDPLAHIDLDIRKLPRIFAEPWNDFRRAAVLRDAPSIRIAHQFLVSLALAALASALAVTIHSATQLFKNKDQDFVDDKQDHLIVLMWLALLGHLIYAAFEGIPRYGFTAAPLYFVALAWFVFRVVESRLTKFAAINLLLPALLLTLVANFARVQTVLQWIGNPIVAGVILGATYIAITAWLLYRLAKAGYLSRISSRAMKISCVMMFIAFGITVTLSLLKEVEAAELAAKLSSEVMATREIDLTDVHKPWQQSEKPIWALLLIDSEKEIAQSHITLNEHKIHEIPKNVYHFYQKKFDLVAFMEEFAADIKVPADDVRQWRAVPIPIDYVNLSGKNKITISGSTTHPLTIYGDYKQTLSGRAPSYEYLSHGRIFVNASSMEWRPRVEFIANAPSQSFIESNERKYPFPPNPDLSSAPGVQDGRLRILLAVGFSADGNRTEFKSQETSIPMNTLNFRAMSEQGKESHASEKSSVNTDEYLKFNSACLADVPLQLQPQTTHAVVELTGKLSELEAERSQAVVRISLNGTNGKPNPSEHDLYFDSKGQPKPQSVCFPTATQMVMLNGKEPTSINIKSNYPVDVVSGRGDHLTIELIPMPQGKAMKLENAELSVRQLSWPDLGRGKVVVY